MDKIDFVILWVDQNDKEWQESKNKYLPDDQKNIDCSEIRYRDVGTVKYLLRSIELYAPWVNKVFFVTAGHLPPWININNKKLIHVKHKDFMDQEYLPTFNCNPIELNLHKIKDLSNQFVYFNDDFLISNPVLKEQFFKSGIPRDFCINLPLVANGKDFFMQMLFNNMSIINKNFSLKTLLNKSVSKYYNYRYKKYILFNLILSKYNAFYGFMANHHPQPLLKQTLEVVWSTEKDSLHETCLHKFRSPTDLTAYIFRYWQLASGEFYPTTYTDRYYTTLESSGDSFKKILFSKKYKFVCLNDSSLKIDYDKKQKEFLTILEEKYPEKSTFEA